ncbi:ATP-binding protein [Mesorhizobium sp.]|uniref:ATP-binding protein n=1 Tax=Mesorhizobium sp. TaxID=1871066 RepID=UPI003BAC6BBC
MISDERARTIGKVVSVTSDRFVVEMQGRTDNFTVVGFDGIHYVARIGSFVIIPVQSEKVVAEVVGLRERDPGASDHAGELDKAASAKFLDLTPVGNIVEKKSDETRNGLVQRQFEFRFGVTTFPSLYADALYALPSELDLVFDTADTVVADEPGSSATEAEGPTAGSDGQITSPIAVAGTRLEALKIGKSSVFQDYDVKVRIDAFFGGHVAILGNTGSGKSCTVASVMQSLFERPDEHHARGATFVVFDVNGEYEAALGALPHGIQTTVLTLDGSADEGKLTLPHWMLDFSEWELLLKASERAQLPVLRNALGIATFMAPAATGADAIKLRRHIIASAAKGAFQNDVGGGAGGKGQLIYGVLERFADSQLNTDLLTSNNFNSQYGTFNPSGAASAAQNQKNFLDAIDRFILPDAKMPTYKNVPFEFPELETAFELAILYAEAHGNRQIRDYCSSMLTRHSALSDRADYRFMRAPLLGGQTARSRVSDYYKNLLGLESNNGSFIKKANVIVIDLSQVDDEIVELVTSFVGRTLFKLLRASKNRNKFPIHLVLEEAHRYISEKPSRFAVDAGVVFERIAKEGRKYGLLLILASQRPSELSKTVLSQCANFLVHRIQNPDDLLQIRQMTPSISDAILKRLPTLPKQHALAFGSAVALPATFRVRTAHPRPDSHDAEISKLWYRGATNPLKIDLSSIIAADDPPAPGDASSSPYPAPSPGSPTAPTTITTAEMLDDEIPF